MVASFTVFVLTGVSSSSDIIRLREQGPDFFKSFFAWRKHADEMVLCVFGMGHDYIQSGEIVLLDIDFLCAK